MNYRPILNKIKSLDTENSSKDKILQSICTILAEDCPHYDWVGFYLADPEKRELFLGPFVGEPTEHVKIKYGQGICGQAAERETTFVVDDVAEEQNYLSCSPKVRSEIVVPIFREDRVIGEIDIDSHRVSAFTLADRELLEEIANWVGPYL